MIGGKALGKSGVGAVEERRQRAALAPATSREGFFQRRRHFFGMGRDEKRGIAAADQPVVPAEVVVEAKLEQRRRIFGERDQRPPTGFHLQAAAAHRPRHRAVRANEQPRTGFLRRASLDVRQNADGESLSGAKAGENLFHEGDVHGPIVPLPCRILSPCGCSGKSPRTRSSRI